MSWLSSTLHSALNFLGGPLGPLLDGQYITKQQIEEAGLGATAVGGYGWLAGLFSGGIGGGGNWGSIENGIKSLLHGAVGDLESLFKDATSSIESIYKDAQHLQNTELGHFITGINNTIDTLSKDVSSFLSPVQNLIASVSGVVQNFNDRLVQPIANDIKATHDATQALVKAFHTDLQGGLKGLVKLPLDITNALTSLDATYQRGQQELGTQQVKIATDIFKPALEDSIGGPLKGTYETFKTPVFTEDQAAAFTDLVNIDEHTSMEEAIKVFQNVEKILTDTRGFLGPILRGIYAVLKAGDFIVAQVEQTIELVRQKARADNPVTLLGVGETIEAWRRGVIGQIQAYEELSHHGIDESRVKVLYDLAQFLFGPKDAVELRARSIIDDATLTTLMDQNNLDPGQVDALTQLMQHILGPGDIAAAQAREFITGELATSMYEAAMVPPELMTIIAQLETRLIDPKLMIAMSGRAAAAEIDFLVDTLKQEPPGDVSSQFDRTQAETGTAALNWLAHWHIPGPEWWVDAYFRGIRTRTEVEAAFVANNVPREIWDDIFRVEEELPPVWLVPDIVASGVWGEAEAVPQLMKLGFSEENAKILYQYGYSKSKSAKATTATDLQKVSLGNAAAAFNDGLIDEKEYLQVLLDHGYSHDAAALTVQLDQYKQAVAARNDAAQAILDSANLGQITDTQAQSDWFSLGLTQTEVDKWLLKLHKAKTAKVKLLSESQVEKLYKKGLIDKAEVLVRLGLLGYSYDDAQLLLDLM